jgi:hypothetical protein
MKFTMENLERLAPAQMEEFRRGQSGRRAADGSTGGRLQFLRDGAQDAEQRSAGHRAAISGQGDATQVVGCVETISERHLIPVLQPCCIISFRSASWAFIATTARSSSTTQFPSCSISCWWSRTKSRPYRTTHNALVEGKNGAVIRKHIGYGVIAAEHAEEFPKFYWIGKC